MPTLTDSSLPTRCAAGGTESACGFELILTPLPWPDRCCA
jgi:hypothetical protein